MFSKVIGQKVKVIIDRPLGSRHPKYKDLIYPINYGYVEEIIGGDGEEQDAYILKETQPLDFFEGIVVGVVMRKNDVETKWIVVKEKSFCTKEEILEAIYFQEKYFEIELYM